MPIFDGGRLTDAQTAGIRLPADELRGWAWWPPAEADRLLSAPLARRAAAARAAPAGGTTAYLENGHPAG